MAHIVVIPEHLRRVSSNLRINSENIYTLATQLKGAANSLDWEVHASTNIDASVNNAYKKALDVAAELMVLSQFLSRKAQAFEDTDMQCAEGLQVLDASITRFTIDMPQSSLPITGWGRSMWPFLPVIGLPRPAQSFIERFLLRYPKPVRLVETSPIVGEECVDYARRRRPDLGPTGGTVYSGKEVVKWGGAADYINKYKNKAFQVTTGDVDLRLKIAKGYALIWPRNIGGAKKSGHVAIVEEVGKDFVRISDANWEGQESIWPLEKLTSLYFIP